MSEETSTVSEELESILRRLQEGLQELTASIEKVAPAGFERKRRGGDTVKRVLERAVDDLNHYYGRMVANALSLPQPPYMEPADFSSLKEASASLQLAHRRLSNLLHDLSPADLERKTKLESTSEYTLRQVLETAAADHRVRARRIREAAKRPAKKRTK